MKEEKITVADHRSGFYDHLLKKGHAFNTVRTNTNIVKVYLAYVTGDPTAATTLMDYIEHCKQSGNSHHTINMKVVALCHYFDFLELKENPAQKIKLQGRTYKVPTLLLDTYQLTGIYNSQPIGGLVQKRAKVMLSLMIFQAITPTEAGQIEVTDLNLQEGTIYIPRGRKSNSRTLELKSHQLLLLQDYLVKVRPQMLRETGKSTNKLFFTLGVGEGKKRVENVISILRIHLKNSDPKFRSFQQIRQSRITLWIEEHGLRKAQYMAGHRYVSSTERYRTDHDKTLRKELNIHHPL